MAGEICTFPPFTKKREGRGTHFRTEGGHPLIDLNRNNKTATTKLPVAQGTGSSMVERRVSGGAGSNPAARDWSGVARFTFPRPIIPRQVFFSGKEAHDASEHFEAEYAAPSAHA